MRLICLYITVFYFRMANMAGIRVCGFGPMLEKENEIVYVNGRFTDIVCTPVEMNSLSCIIVSDFFSNI